MCITVWLTGTEGTLQVVAFHRGVRSGLYVQLCVTVLHLYRDDGVVIRERLAGKRSLHVLSRGSTRLCDIKKGQQQPLAATSQMS